MTLMDIIQEGMNLLVKGTFGAIVAYTVINLNQLQDLLYIARYGDSTIFGQELRRSYERSGVMKHRVNPWYVLKHELTEFPTFRTAFRELKKRCDRRR